MVRNRPLALQVPKILHLHSITPSIVTALITINSTTIPAVIDTGAAVSVIHSCFSDPNLYSPCHSRIRAVNGNIIPVLGTTTISITVNHTKLSLPCVVTDGIGRTCIIGADFLRSQKATVDFENHVITAPTWSLPLLINTLPTVSQVQHSPHVAMEHAIPIPADTKPIHCRAFRPPLHLQDFVNTKVEEMLKRGVISPSSSPWSAPVVLVKKKTGDLRFCVDFRRLNAITKTDRYPIPLIDELIDKLRGQSIYSTLDLRDGYWQVPMRECDREKTAFTIQGIGHFEFNVMPFGLCNAPATFQRMMSNILKDLPGTSVYLDDIIVSGASIQEHDRNLERVLSKLKENGLSLNDKKCHLRKTQVDYLGHSVSAAGLKPNGEKVQAILSIKTPVNINEVRTFLGMASYYRKFIQKFSEMAEPLTQLTLKEKKFEWGTSQQKAFLNLKLAISTCPTLQFPKQGGKFRVSTDASDVGLGATLTQIDPENHEFAIAFASRTLSRAEKNLAVIERECLAIVWALSKWRHYLLGRQFTIRTDHKPLQWLHTMKDNNGKLTRWALKLAEYDFDIHYIKGQSNIVPDALSRLPIEVNSITFSTSMKMSELAQLQTQDSELAPVIFALKNPPTAHNSQPKLYGSSRRFEKLWNQLRLDSDVLIREPLGGGKVIVMPQILRRNLVKDWHAQGHLGITATLGHLQDRFYWPGMGTDVANWIAGCDTCNRRKAWTKEPAAPLRHNLASYPGECWAMDIVGPLEITPSGNRYILSMCDTFTRWPEAVPIPDQKAPTIARAMVDRVIAAHGVPTKILTDQGANFESQLIHQICHTLGTKKIRTTAYHPQGNGLCEKFNGTICDILSTLTNSRGDDWDEVLGLALLHYRTRIHATTGYSPFEMTYGRHPQLLPDLQYPKLPSNPDCVSSEDYLGKLQQTISNIHQTAHNRQTDHLVERKPVPKPLAPLVQGEQVYLKNSARQNKFDVRFKGPFKVAQPIDDQTVLLQTNRGLYRAHRNRIKTLPKRVTRKNSRLDDYISGDQYEQLFRRGGRSVGR